jgi:hypothetical protein
MHVHMYNMYIVHSGGSIELYACIIVLLKKINTLENMAWKVF